MSESIIRDLLHICTRGPPQRKVDNQRSGDDGLPWYKPPGSGIIAVIPVVSEDKVFIRRDHQLAIPRKGLHLPPPLRINIGIGIYLGREIVPELTGRGRLKCGVRFVHRNIVDHDASIFDAQPVARNSDYPLHQIWMRLRMMKHDNIATLDLPVGQQVFCNPIARPKDLLINK